MGKLYRISKIFKIWTGPICHGRRILFPYTVVITAIDTDDRGEGIDEVIVEGRPILEAAVIIDIEKTGTVVKGAISDGGDGGGNADGLQRHAACEGIFFDGFHSLGNVQSPEPGAALKGA